MSSVPHPDDPRWTLRADCARCAALCCVVPAFRRSADFAIDKPARRACPHLDDHSFGCTIHTELRPRGFPGCEAYDCFGAGQQVVEHVFAGRSWRSWHGDTATSGPEDLAGEQSSQWPGEWPTEQPGGRPGERPGERPDPTSAPRASAAADLGLVADVFEGLRGVHELRWYLAEAIDRTHPGPLRDDLVGADAALEQLTHWPAEGLAGLDLGARRGAVVPLLREASRRIRVGVGPGSIDLDPLDLTGHDLSGTDLRGRALRGASLRGALLIGADLSGVDLARTDLTGADLRAADLRGALLHEALFVTRGQLGSARGDAATTVPAVLQRPAHWPG